MECAWSTEGDFFFQFIRSCICNCHLRFVGTQSCSVVRSLPVSLLRQNLNLERLTVWLGLTVI